MEKNILTDLNPKNPDFRNLVKSYRTELLDSVVPFWLKYAIDTQHGGICTCLNDKGEILSYDKYMWSQLRAIWTFSALYNRIERRKEWLDAAENIFDFVREYGRDKNGSWLYSTTSDGEALKGATSIYSDGFAISGFTEFAKASGQQEAIRLATDTFYNVKHQLDKPGSYQTEPLTIPSGCIAHGISMIFSKVFYDLGKFLNNREIITEGIKHAEKVMTVFLRPDKKKLFEFVKTDNTLLGTPPGLTVVPGHVLESMWFMIHIYQGLDNNERIKQALECIRWHIELGWDNEFEGILLARDAKGTFWENKWDTKLWWVHSEALYALLLAYSICREEWCIEWYNRIQRYTFSHFPVPVYGEWYQRLDRHGNHISNIKDLPVKDPFHTARALLNCILVLEKLASA